jgi:hypothetical protein
MKTKPKPTASPTVEMLDPRVLKARDRNPRTHPPEQLDALSKSIREFGFTAPVLIDAEQTLIAGHGRVAAAIHAGLEAVPCIRVTHLSEAQVRAYVIADNRLAEGAAWDKDILGAELKALAEMDFDISLTGFEVPSIDVPSCNPDSIPDTPADAVTQRGDVWTMGRHRLVCGDSSDPRDIAKLLGDEQPSCSIVDPPYELKESVWSKWIMDPCIVFGQAKHIRMIPDKLWRFERVIVKRHKHRSATVQVRHAHAFVVQAGTDKKLPDDKKATLPSVIEQEADTDHDHQKPASLIAEHLTHWTPTGNSIVIDPFAGSGSTLIACEMTGRIARCMEMEPGFCDVIVRRWEEFTGMKATRGNP